MIVDNILYGRYDKEESQANAKKKIQIFKDVIAEAEKEGKSGWHRKTVKYYDETYNCSSFNVFKRFSSDNLDDKSFLDLKSAINKEFGLHRYDSVQGGYTERHYRNWNFYFHVGDGSVYLNYKINTVDGSGYNCTVGGQVERGFSIEYLVHNAGKTKIKAKSLTMPLKEENKKGYIEIVKKIDSALNYKMNAKSRSDNDESYRAQKRAAYRSQQKARRREKSRQHMRSLQGKIKQNMEFYGNSPNYVKKSNDIQAAKKLGLISYSSYSTQNVSAAYAPPTKYESNFYKSVEKSNDRTPGAPAKLSCGHIAIKTYNSNDYLKREAGCYRNGKKDRSKAETRECMDALDKDHDKKVRSAWSSAKRSDCMDKKGHSGGGKIMSK